MIKKIKIPYFHIGLKYTTPLFIGLGIYLAVVGHFIWALAIVLVCIVILTTQYVTEINIEASRLRDYLFFLGFSLNEDVKQFSRLDRIVVTKGDYAQNIQTRAQSRQLDWVDYTGTLVFDDNDTLELLTRNDREELLKGLKEFANFLQVDVEDRTTTRHFWVDLSKF